MVNRFFVLFILFNIIFPDLFLSLGIVAGGKCSSEMFIGLLEEKGMEDKSMEEEAEGKDMTEEDKFELKFSFHASDLVFNNNAGKSTSYLKDIFIADLIFFEKINPPPEA